MIRNLKVLGLALAAVFAFAAVTASAASAASFLTSDGPVTLTGTETGATTANQLSAFSGQAVRCPGSLYTGHTVDVTPHQFIPATGQSSVTITPHYKNCITEASGLTFPTTVDMNGCDFDLELGATNLAHAEDTYNLNAKVTCPGTEHIKVTVFGSAAKHTANEPFCVITVEQNAGGYAGLVARDTTNGEIDITGTASPIKVSRTSPTGSILCTNKTDENATLSQDITVTGDNEAGGATAISLSHNP